MGPRDLNNEVPRASSNDAHLRSIIQCAGVCVWVKEERPRIVVVRVREKKKQWEREVGIE